MRTYNEKLEGLRSDSVWVFTKQDTSFDEAFKATLLFSEIEDKDKCSIEEYFETNHQRYGIKTNRHRMLVISQLYGLITKTPFYNRGGRYCNETSTAVFDCNRGLEIGSREYNLFKTEQLLKVKIHAIIDSANNNEDYNILPIVFIYKVLKTLKDEYGIDGITIEQLYTYVLTCKNYSEWEEAVEFIKSNAPVSQYVKAYEGLSRVLTFIKNNIGLFTVTNKRIAINQEYDDYFNNNFAKKHDIAQLHELLRRDVDYSYFLYNPQGFNVNLIDVPSGEYEGRDVKNAVDATENEQDEDGYLEKVDAIDEKNFNEEIAKDAYNTEPSIIPAANNKGRFKKNPLLGKIAIKKAGYKCECDFRHETFVSGKTQKNYMEAHHLIPMCFQKEIWDKYGVNIDCLQNLVCLCPTCHKAIHYGTDEVKKELIEKLYKRCLPYFKNINLNVTLEEIKTMYKL